MHTYSAYMYIHLMHAAAKDLRRCAHNQAYIMHTCTYIHTMRTSNACSPQPSPKMCSTPCIHIMKSYNAYICIHIVHTCTYISCMQPPTISEDVLKTMLHEHPYFTLAREVYYGGIRTPVGELQTVVVHAMVIFFGCFLAYFFCLTSYYARLAEFGIADIYPGGGSGWIQVCVCMYVCM
jgi:hypothetical protein